MQNMYADMMKMWTNNMQNPMASMPKMPQMPQMQMPTLDMNAFVAMGKRNAEACSEAVSCVTEGLQTVARRQADIARNSVQNVLKTSKDMLVNGSPEINTAKQAEFAKSLIEQSVSNLREVSELCTKAGFEAFDVLNKRAAESFEEISGVAKGSKKKSA